MSTAKLILSAIILFPSHVCSAETKLEIPAIPEQITIENVANGKILAYFKNVGEPVGIGNVLKPLEEDLSVITVPGFTAANFFKKNSCVVASAANAIHIRVRENAGGMAMLFSFVPKEYYSLDRSSYTSYSGASVYTDIPGGTGLFGREYSPFLGNEILVKRDGNWTKMDSVPGYKPKLGDVWAIKISPPVKQITEVRFQNKINGEVTVKFADGTDRLAARVIRPVQGVGGFTGAVFAGSGQMRAQHPGVVEIATSKRFEHVDAAFNPPPGEGKPSAFQIVPFAHTEDYAGPGDGFGGEGFFGYARTVPVYMLLDAPGTKFETLDKFADGDPAAALRRRFMKELRKNSISPQMLASFSEIPYAKEVAARYKNIENYFEIGDRDGSAVFGRLVRPAEKEEPMYAHGLLFGEGWLRPREGEIKVRKTGSSDFVAPPEFNQGKDLKALADWEEIILYLPLRGDTK